MSLIRLHECTGWSVPLLLVFNKSWFSEDEPENRLIRALDLAILEQTSLYVIH